MRDPAENAQLALILEVSGTPKPGNVDRRREYDDLRFEHFLAGAVGARRGFALAAGSTRIGRAFERGVDGMAEQTAGNTQFGAVLVLTPLVRAAATDRLSPAGIGAVVENTTVADACDFYRAFEHVDVAIDDPPEGLDDFDVRRGRDAVTAVREQAITLAEVMTWAEDRDGVAAEWTNGFERSFEAATWLEELDATEPLTRRTSEVYLRLLAAEPDTFVVTRNGSKIAEEVSRRAGDVLDGQADPEAFADELVDRDVNPGTTADLTAAALFIALERGLEV